MFSDTTDELCEQAVVNSCTNAFGQIADELSTIVLSHPLDLAVVAHRCQELVELLCRVLVVLEEEEPEVAGLIVPYDYDVVGVPRSTPRSSSH